MKKTSINVRVNQEEKKEAERVLENLGVSMSSAINMYIIQIAKQKKIPFEIKEETYEDKVKIMIEKAKSKNLIKTYDEFLNTKEADIYTINEDTINYKQSNKRLYEIGDIVYVLNYKYKNKRPGKNHCFVIINKEIAIELTYFGYLLSSQINKASYPYNTILKKNTLNNLNYNSIVKCDDLIEIKEDQIQCKIGKVSQNQLEEFNALYNEYLETK